MFELLIAFRYLLPRKQQLSVALISLLSITVISLVVWLLVIFLSVTEGIERGWLTKLTSLNAPLRITPTAHYYRSYYYRIDEISESSHYQAKNILEKKETEQTDPYQPEEDEELPLYFPRPEYASNGELKDPVKQLFACLNQLKQNHIDLRFQEFEIGGALLRLQLLRPASSNPSRQEPNYLTQVSYLATFPDACPTLDSFILPPQEQDIAHLHYLINHQPSDPAKNRLLLSKIESLLKDGSQYSFQWIQTLKEQNVDGQAGIFLAKQYQDTGVRIGDRGYLSYSSATINAVQEEQRLPVFVAGFYDPGILAIGNKSILVPPFITQLMNASNSSFYLDKTQSNGVLVWFKDIQHAKQIKKELFALLNKAELTSYWDIKTFQEYDFAKDLIQQFQSDRYLFTLVGIIILLVACCNIISLLILLVNDKKKEIGVLQAMGASKKSIALIFGACGMFIGSMSSLIGSLGAALTLSHIDSLVQFLSFLQGQDTFNVAFFGQSLPKEMSHRALIFVLIVTPLLSLIAGLVPAIKACRFRLSELLRSE